MAELLNRSPVRAGEACILLFLRVRFEAWRAEWDKADIELVFASGIVKVRVRVAEFQEMPETVSSQAACVSYCDSCPTVTHAPILGNCLQLPQGGLREVPRPIWAGPLRLAMARSWPSAA